MNTGLRLSLLIMLVAMGPAACASLSKITADLPLSRQTCPYGFAADYEVRATLGLRTSGHKEEYLLAIRTGGESADLAVLTPQGIPVYSIHCSESGLEISSQTRLAGGISAVLMLSYLEMIFIGGDRLRQLLQPGWAVEEGGDMRLLSRRSVDGVVVGGININYMGDPPWFKTVKLEDTLRETTLVLGIMGSSLVLPK
jgi:hypothetical protein